MVSRTPRKKGVRRTHRRKQRGGAGTNGKSNYTLFYAGWRFERYTGSGSMFRPGPPGDAFFPYGTDLICDTDNNLYLTSWYIGSVMKIDTKGNMTLITGSKLHANRLGWKMNGSWPLLVSGNAPGEPISLITATGVMTDIPYVDNDQPVMAVCGDSVGNIYYIGSASQCIFRINSAGNSRSVFAGSQSSSGDVDGPVSTARFSSPGSSGNGMIYDPRTNAIYMYDAGNFKYKKISLSTNTVTTLATTNPRGRYGYLAVHPYEDILYYTTCYNDVTPPTRPPMVYTINLNTLAVKRYAGGGVTTSGVADAMLADSIRTSTKTSTVYDNDADFTGDAVFNDVVSCLAIDYTGCLFIVGTYYPRIWAISPVTAAQAPSSIYTIGATGNSVTIAWSNDTNAGSYAFTISPAPPSVVIPLVKYPATSATFRGLAECTVYTITVTGSNRLGTAPPVTVVSQSGIDTTNFVLLGSLTSSINTLTPDTPSVVSATLAWTGIPKVPNITYTITPSGSGPSGSSGASGASGDSLTGTIPPSASKPFIVSGLQPNTTYTAKITGSLADTLPISGATSNVYSVTSNTITFTTPPLNPVYLGTVVGPGSFAANASGPTPMTTTLTGNRDIAQDANGNLYIASTTCIYKITPPTGATYYLFDSSQPTPTPTQIYNTPVGFPGSRLSILAGSTTTGRPSTTAQTGSAIQFGNIFSMVYSASQNCLYVSDVTYDVIVRVTLTAPVTATVIAGRVSGTAVTPPTVGRDGVLGTATLNYPKDLSVGPNNELFISDYSSNAIRSLSLAGVLSTLATTPSGAASGSQAKTPLSITNPSSIVQMLDGSLLVACSTEHVIRKLTPSRINVGSYDMSLYAGRLNTSGNADGPLGTATFNSPHSLALDAAYNVYVYDSGNYAIRLIIGQNVYTYLGNGIGNSDGPAATAKFRGGVGASAESSFTGMYFDTNGTFYISDMGNGTVRAVTAYPMNLVVSGEELTYYRASAARASSALVQSASSAVAQDASSAVAQGVSSALAQRISGARESSATAQDASSAIAQTVSSALAERISGARESSATAQTVSSALAQSISGARESSATAQTVSSALMQSISGAEESSARAQDASSALAQSISGAQQSSAVAQTVSSALAQKISGAEESSARAQDASSALAQSISGARESSATAQQESSALMQSISGAQQSSAVAQRASSALMQSISGAQQSSAVAQTVSSALAQSISGAEESSARAQDASSALAQSISGARESSATAQTVSSALAQSISGAQESSATAQRASSALMQSISGAEESSARAQDASSALAQSISGAQESSARAQDVSSAVAQTVSSALAQKISGALEQYEAEQRASSSLAQSISGARESSATAQTVSSALAQSISGARESSATAQTVSSALAQSISGAQQSSAVAQTASSALAQSISGAEESSAVAQRASSALAQSISGAEESSARAQDASSALAQSISGAQESSATAQYASSAVAQTVSSALAQKISGALEEYEAEQRASSSLAQSISGARASSAVAQTVSSALAQSISGAEASSATAQRASSSLAQSISGAQESSARAQDASSALAQSISGAQESSATAQDASSAVAQTVSSALAQKISGALDQYEAEQRASSSLAQSISGARESSATAQTVSSALAQSISGAEASSATAQVASSAVAQTVSSALAQSISGAQASSATAQVASSALAQSISGARASSALAQEESSAIAQKVSAPIAQRASSSVAQTASSAQLSQALSLPVSTKDTAASELQGFQTYALPIIKNLYSKSSSPEDVAAARANVTDLLSSHKSSMDAITEAAAAVFKVAPMYQDRALQIHKPFPALEAKGYFKLYDMMRGKQIVIDSKGYIVDDVDTVANRRIFS